MAKLYQREEFVYNKIPIRIYNHSIDGIEIFTPIHWHHNIEFNLVTAGRICRIVDGIHYNQKEGDLIIVNSDQLHGDHWIQETDHFEGVTVQISKSFMDGWLGENYWLKCPTQNTVLQPMKMILIDFGKLVKAQQLHAFNNVFEETSDGSLENDMLRIKAMELLFQLVGYLRQYCVENRKENESNQDVLNKIKEITRYIDKYYAENLKLSSVAEQFHYTPSHLSRLFKEHLGINFHIQLQHIRLMHCIDIMNTHPEQQLMHIALDNGFSNYKSFIETFKLFYGCTPSEWMKRKHKI